MKNRFLSCICICLFMVSCGIPEKEYQKLKEENKILKKQILECNLTAPELLKQAQKFQKEENYRMTQTKITTLLKQYPNSIESTKAKKILLELRATSKKKKLVIN